MLTSVSAVFERTEVPARLYFQPVREAHGRIYSEDADNQPSALLLYAASKKAAETLAYTYHYLHGIDVSIVRYFTVYGPAGRPDMSIFRFIRWIAQESRFCMATGARAATSPTWSTLPGAPAMAAFALRLRDHQPRRLHRPTMSAIIEQIAGLVGSCRSSTAALSIRPTSWPPWG